jgi:transcriptional regulator with XRE-family HTH domain
MMVFGKSLETKRGFPMKFWEKLRKIRDAKGLSEVKLAEKSGITFASVHQYSQGRRKPSFSAVVKLVKALGVACQEFADCEDIAEDGEDEKQTAKAIAPNVKPTCIGEAFKPAGKKAKR